MKSYSLLTDEVNNYEENFDYDKCIESLNSIFDSKVYKEFKQYEFREELINFYVENSKYICENILHIPNDSLLLYLTEEEAKKEDGGFIKLLKDVGAWIKNALKQIGDACGKIFTSKGRKAAETLEEKSKKYDEVVKVNETLQNQLNTLKGQNSISAQSEIPEQSKQQVQQMQSVQAEPKVSQQNSQQDNQEDNQEPPKKKNKNFLASLFGLGKKPNDQQAQVVQTKAVNPQQNVQQQDQSIQPLNLLNSFYTWASQLYKEININQSNNFNSQEIQEKINQSEQNTKEAINKFLTSQLAKKLKSSEITKNSFNNILSLLEVNGSETIEVGNQLDNINYNDILPKILNEYNKAKELISEFDKLTSKGDKEITEYTIMYKAAIKYLLLVTLCFGASYFGAIILTKSSNSSAVSSYKIPLCEAITYTNYLYSKIVKDESFLLKYKNVIKDNNEYLDTVYFRFGQIITLCLASATTALISIIEKTSLGNSDQGTNPNNPSQSNEKSSTPTENNAKENPKKDAVQWRNKQPSIVKPEFTEDFIKAFGPDGNINSITRLIEDAGFSKNLTLDKIIAKAYSDIKNLSGDTNNLIGLSSFFKDSIVVFNTLWEDIKAEIDSKGSSDKNKGAELNEKPSSGDDVLLSAKEIMDAVNSRVVEKQKEKQKGLLGTVKGFIGVFFNANKNEKKG